MNKIISPSIFDLPSLLTGACVCEQFAQDH